MTPGKVLITGGAGYIGTHTLVELAASGFEPLVIDDLSRSTRRLIEGAERIAGRKFLFEKIDCKSSAQLKTLFERHPDIGSVIHFAAFKSVNESVEKPLMYYQNNIGSLTSLLETMMEFSVTKLVFSSSCTVYGQPDKIPVTELTPFKDPETPYGASKQIGERLLQDLVKAWKDLQVVSLRYFNPIGAHSSGLIGELPLDEPNNLVPYITQTAIGKRKELIVFGNDYQTPDGSCLRDFIHVMDLATAHVQALKMMDSFPQRYEAINLGTGKPYSVLELINAFMKVTGVKLNYKIGKRRVGDIEKVYADPEKSRKLLNWETVRTVEEALLDAWNWEKNISK